MITKLQSSMNKDVPLYNIRILKTYLDYVQKKYPNINIDKILDYAGISKPQLNDSGYWYSQRQANRVHEVVVKQTGNKNISRDAGRHLMTSQNIIAQYVLGFKNSTSVALQIAAIYSKLSLGVKIGIKKLEKNKFEFIVKPRPGVTEQLFQCMNRIGSFEGIYKFITGKYPTVEHPECYHEGAKHCRYIVSWDKPSATFKWLRIRNHSIVAGIFIALITLSLFPLNYFLISSLVALLVISTMSHYVHILEKRNLDENIEELGKTAEELWGELNIRYNLTKLVKEVGEVTSFIQNEKEIASSVSTVMSKQLDYDRGAILLANDNNKTLSFVGGFGFTDDEIEIMNYFQFRLDNKETEGVLQKVFIKQEPTFVEDINKIDTLDANSLDLVKRLKVKSMICVPIVHGGLSIGVMTVDSLEPKRELREGDINLLMAVASQTALSIAHAKAFHKLQESEEKHRTLVETIRDIVYTVDLEGRFTYVSPMIEVITGYTESELYGIQFSEIVSPQYKDIVKMKFTEGLKTDETSTYEIGILAKDGTTIPMELNASSLTDNRGQSIGSIGVARDITRRHMEETKRQEMEMRALTQDKLASLGEIATGIAHEINQPLSYIKIILQSTLSDVSKDQLDTEELTEDFQESIRQVGKISNIISHLRTFGRSDVTSFGPVSLSAVVHDTLILMRERLRVKNISMDINLNDNFPMLYGNHIKLEQVFLNLIQNSMDALEEQGSGEISLSAEIENKQALISFSDTGEGVDSEFREKIFEPFFTTKEAEKGTGIGLSIVYGIIYEHQGTISIETQEEKGANFKIKLPVFKDKSDNSLTEPLNA
jgi:PAS domain S-box-containing protein